jgi:(Z)-2-((N-methylformamido)methylene)-5-hydroxybutyrolactone dehydrogenase
VSPHVRAAPRRENLSCPQRTLNAKLFPGAHVIGIDAIMPWFTPRGQSKALRTSQAEHRRAVLKAQWQRGLRVRLAPGKRLPLVTRGMVMQRTKMLIGGEWVEPAGGAWFDSENPFTGKPWATVPRGQAADVERAVEAAHEAFRRGPWRALTASARGALLRRLGDVVAKHADRLSEIETRDNGKLLAEMRAQLRYIPQWFYYFAGLADKVEGRVIPIDKPGVLNFTREEPLGVVAAITPWNSPLILATWKLAPALAAGNTVVWKPSEFSSVSALAFGELFEDAGLPRGVVNIVTGFGSEIGEALITHRHVAKIAFTGGDVTGQRVYELAARGIKRVTLELGGKSANIVFADADLDNAVKGAVSGIFAATGQTCIAGSRLLLQRSIHDEFLQRLVAMAKSARMGDPLLETTQVGPVTTRAQFKKILEYIDIAKQEGAKCILGGAAASREECGDGWFIEPTIFAGVHSKMRIAQEEVFGPVLAVIPFDDDEDAIRIANDTVYGLAAGVWTQSINRALRMSERLEAGTVWINTYRATSYMSPFGGYRRSGFGREAGLTAIREYMQEKSVWIDTTGQTPNPYIQK